MNSRDLRHCLEQLADERRLRWTEKNKRYLGLHRGIVIDVGEWDGVVDFRFFSPTATIEEQIFAGVDGFDNLSSASVPVIWVTPMDERDANGREFASNRACQLFIDANRLSQIGVETFLKLPDLMAEDLHTHGAAQTLPCGGCGKREASLVGRLDFVYSPLCDPCWHNLVFASSAGKVPTDQTVSWARVLPLLAIGTTVAAIGWGFLQQQQAFRKFGIFAVFLPVVWAYGLCLAVGAVSRGVTRSLRLLLCASVVISVLGGNVWRFRCLLVQAAEAHFGHEVEGPNWLESFRLYFKLLQFTWKDESAWLLGGIFASWLALRLLKSAETIEVR